LLRRIDAKLGALLAIALDDYVRSHGIAGARSKTIDVLLHDAGLSTAEIASMLVKTQRAVQIAVSTTPAKAPPKRASRQ
jgi:hypothetical protein